MKTNLKQITKKLAIGLCAVITAASFTACGGNNTDTKKTAAKFDSSNKITVVSREDGSGTRGAFIELMGVEEKGADGSKTDKTTKSAVIANKTGVVLTNIEQDEYGIGYISLGSLNNTVKALKVDGTEATADNVKMGTYKVSRPFNIATKGTPNEVTQDFIDYILSSDGQNIVDGSGYIAIKDDASPYNGKKPSGKIVVAGSSSVTPVMEKLKEGYLSVNENAEIEIQMSDSTAGMTGAMEGTCDIGMASRELKDSEKSLTALPIALDGIAIIVNKANPLDDISADDVKQIYTGEKTAWSDIIK